MFCHGSQIVIAKLARESYRSPMLTRNSSQAVAEPVVTAFGAGHVEALTGLSRYQLREWDKAGFFAPEYAFENRRVAHGRVYSFTDVVGLRTLSVLSKTHKIALPELKRVAEALAKWSAKPWADFTLYVVNKEVHFRNPNTGRIEGVRTGQGTVAIPLENVMEDMRARADRLRIRDKTKVGEIERHRFRMRNRWVVGGTRIPVSAIYNFTDAGYSARQIVAEYPDLKLKDIRAALDKRPELTMTA
jgi:uncharacterized protein (DUF433 family)